MVGNNTDADPQGEAMVKLGWCGPEGQGNVAAEAAAPPEAGGEEHAVHGERICAGLPVDFSPGRRVRR